LAKNLQQIEHLQNKWRSTDRIENRCVLLL